LFRRRSLLQAAGQNTLGIKLAPLGRRSYPPRSKLSGGVNEVASADDDGGYSRRTATSYATAAET